MEALCSSEMWGLTKPSRGYIPEDGILQSHHRENLNLGCVSSEVRTGFLYCLVRIIEEPLELKNSGSIRENRD
jgi:hypothetical protein